MCLPLNKKLKHTMRVVATIPHVQCHISIFQMNDKFIIKIEKSNLEQSFKVSQMDVMTIEELKALITENFIERVMDRFKQMQTDLDLALGY